MYKDELKEQIKTLKLTQKICKADPVNAITISREILRLTSELEKIETEKKRIWTSLRKAQLMLCISEVVNISIV